MKSTTLLQHPLKTWSPPYTSRLEWQQWYGWAATIIVLPIMYKIAAVLIAPVLEKLYELLILKNVLGL